MNSAFFKKNWYLLTPATILLVPALIALFCMVNYGYSFSESMKYISHIGSTGTRYSQEFSERKFKMLRPGMDGRSVYNVIRNPMERNMPEDTEWRYSLPASGATCYHERTIIMEKDKNGIPRVKNRISRFHSPD